jgi:hypothetical protein
MFGKMGLHVIQFPSGKFGFVGSIPGELGTEVPASRAAVMGQRSFYNAAGELVEMKFPVFESEVEAWEFAESKGFPK